MTVSTLRPNASFPSNVGGVGGGTQHGVMSDDSDGSYAWFGTNDYSTVGFTDFTLPAGGVIKSARLRVRAAMTSDSDYLTATSSLPSVSETLVTWSTPTTVVIDTTTAVTNATLDAYTVRFYRGRVTD